MITIKWLGAALLLLSTIPAFADAPAAGDPSSFQAAQPQAERQVRFVVGMTLDHQFNKFGTVQFTNGSSTDLGDALVGFSAGAALPLTADRRFEAQGVVGFRFARVGASNGDVSFVEFPIEITGHVNLGSFRLGAGPTFHFAPKLSGSGVAAGIDTKFDPAFGAVGLAEYLFGAGKTKFSFGLRGTWLNLSAGGSSLDASGVGMLFACYL